MNRLLSLALLLAVPTVAAAQTCPVADGDLGSATGLVASGDTCGTGNDQGATCGGFAGSEELIYAWTAPADGTYVISSVGSAFDTVVYAIDGASCAEEVCDDDTDGLTSEVTVDAVAGQTWFIAIDGFGDSSCGAFQLQVLTCSGDSDADGICNELDACEGLNFYGDYDSDGICDDLDPCPDTDGDFVCDIFDTCEGMDWTGDFDADGVCDDLDPCAPDTDGDGTCDAYDLCVGDDATGDFDGDGTCDDTDPCTPDTDGDGTCDAYDFCNGDDAAGDSDFDGVCDDLDFVLEVSRGFSADPTVLTVHNAPAGAVITFVSGRHFGPWCPGASDLVCYSVGTQTGEILAMTRADANGDATFSFVNPDYFDDDLAFQASWTLAGTGDVTNRVVNGQVAPPHPFPDGVYTGVQETVASTCGTLLTAQSYAVPAAVHWTSDFDFVARFPRGAQTGPVRCTESAGALTCSDNRQVVTLMPQAQLLLEFSNALTAVDGDTVSAASEATVSCRGTRCAQFEALYGTTFPCDASFETTYDLRFPL